MPRIKSLILRNAIDYAQKAHNCQANSSHRIQKGDKRFKVRNGRSWNHYCVPCAIQIVNGDINKLNALAPNFQPLAV